MFKQDPEVIWRYFQLDGRVPCPEEALSKKMEMKLEIFWNIAFSSMIVTAMCGNSAVLWIVFRE